MKKIIFAAAIAAMLIPGVASAEDMLTNSALQQMLKNQEKIMQTLEEIKAELQVIKVRATNK